MMSSYRLRNYTYNGVILKMDYRPQIILINPMKHKLSGLRKTEHPILNVKFGIYNQVYTVIDAPQI